MNEKVLQARAIYNLFDLLGDLGGVTEVIMIVFGFFLFPISEHSFVMDAAKKFFMARTSDEQLLADETDEKDLAAKNKYLDPKNYPQDLSDERKEELALHRHINLSTLDNLTLYFANRLGCLFPCFCWSKKDKLQRLYELGDERI